MNKISVKELNEFLIDGKLSEFGTFSEVDIVFVAGLFLLYMQNKDNWTKIPQLFNIEEGPNVWNHSHYFKQIDDLYEIKHNQIFDSFPNASNSNANPVSRYFAPPIYITSKLIDCFFGTKKQDNRINNLKEKYKNIFDISDFIDKTFNNYKKSTQEFKEYTIEIQQRLEAIMPVFVFIFIVSCKRLAKKENRTFEETKNYIEKIWQFTHNYTNGLHELARNIVEHSGHGENDGQGMITIRAYSEHSSNNGQKEKIKVLETHVFDFGKKGIYKTLKQNTEKNKTDSEDDVYTQDFKVLDDKENKYTLYDFIEPKDNKKFLLQQFLREMAHYGLMSFIDLLDQYKGKMIASSVREDNDEKREVYIFSKNVTTEEEIKEIEKYDIKKGTSYYFDIHFIPSLFERKQEFIKELGNQFEVPALSALQNFELVEYNDFIDLQRNERKKYIINLKISESLKNTDHDKIDDRETENSVCDDIIEKLKSPHISIFGNDCFAFDFDGIPINKSNLLRILAKLSREILSDFIVYNINCDVFIGLVKDNEKLFEIIKNRIDYVKDKRIETSYWLKDKSILFFTKKEKPPKDCFYFADFLFGENQTAFNSLNKIVANTFPNTTYINKDKDKDKIFDVDENFSIPQKIQKRFFYHTSNYLLPFDTLLKSKDEEIFLFNINKILQNNLFNRLPYNDVEDYVDNVDSYHIKQTHFKIGNKVHSSDFYYAKQFFQNSFYTTRLAMYLAKKIDKDINDNKNRVALAGYEMYSELILGLIEKFMIDIYGYSNICHFVAQNDGEKMTFLPRETFNDYLKDCEKYKTIIVVPIAATGNTTKKIETEIITRYGKIYPDKIYGAPFLSYNILLAQDPRSEFDIIKNNGEIPPIINLSATWYNLKDCPLCYGIETGPLFDTDNSSLTPSLIFGNPVGQNKSKHGNEVVNDIVRFDVLNFEKSLNYQNTARNDNYRIYDIDSDIFIRDNKPEIKKWLKNTVKLYLEENHNLIIENCNLKPTDRVVIVAPCHESNSQFINLVNENVFSSAATIIHHQNGVDFVENFSLLNKKNLKDENTKIFYIDDSLITGKHFFELFDLIREVTESLQPLTASILINDQAVPFIHNRAVELSKNYFTFVSINQPSTRNILNERPLEYEQKRYKSLQESALHDVLCEYFYVKEQKLIPEKYQWKKKVSSEKRIKHLKLFEATHKIYDYFTKNNNIPDLTNEEERNKFVDFKLKSQVNSFEINSKDTNTKALLKVLSQYPFILYKDLRKETFQWHRELLHKNISDPVNEDCFDIDKDYYGNYDQDNNLTTFKFLFRRAVFLDNYQVLAVNFLKKLLIWFRKIDKYFEQNEIKNDLDDLSLFAQKNNEEKSEKIIENLRDFPIFVLGNYVEMVQKNSWAAYQILKNIEMVNFATSNIGKQFLIMLKIESASVIDDFVKMINKDYRIKWRDMYKDQVELYTGTDRIVNFFDEKHELLETNKYKLVEELFLDENNNLKNENAPIVNYLWIKQLLYADSIDKNPQIQFNYREEIDEIINKMKGFFPDRDKVNAFFIVTDGKQYPHVLSPQNNSIFNEFKYDYEEYKELLKTDNENIILMKEEWPTKILIDILNGESGNMKNSPETTAEFIFENGKWINLYDESDNRSLKFMPSKYEWLYMIRISELKEYKDVEYKFEAQGLLGFYSAEDLSESILAKQLLMLLRKDMSKFIKKHHKNDEFSRLIQQEERNKYVVKLNHGVQTYKNLIEYLYRDEYKNNLEENVMTLLRYLVNKMHLISLLNSDNRGKLEKITLNAIKDEFNKRYKFVFSLPMQTINRIEKTNMDNIVQFSVNFNNLDSTYSFPEKSYQDIIFEILLNIRKYGIKDNVFTLSDKMIINITVEDKKGNRFLAISNTYKGDLGCFENIYNDDEPHGIDLLRQLWHSHKLGRIDIESPSEENKIFKLLIQLKESKDENCS